MRWGVAFRSFEGKLSDEAGKEGAWGNRVVAREDL